MSDCCTEVETALVAMLREANSLRQVKTVEATIRECLFTGNKLIQGFQGEELPALNVSSELKPYTRGPFTAGEIELTIPVSVMAIVRAPSAADARARVREMQAAIEAVLDKARRSDSGLGANTIITGDVQSSLVLIEEKPHHYAIGETQCQVLKVVPLA